MTVSEVSSARLSDDSGALEEAVVLAAGEGTRLRPLTHNRPKPMLPAANRPILEYVFDALIDAGVERIHAVVGYKRDRVQDHFGPSYRDVPIRYVHQEKQLGSGHALMEAREAVDGDFLVVNGDQIIEAEMASTVARAFDSDAAICALAVVERDEAGQYGAVTMRDGRIRSLIEKPGTDEYRLLNAGVYAFDERVFDAIDDTARIDGELALSDTIAQLVESDENVRGVRTDGLWVDATYPWDLLSVASDLLSRGQVDEPSEGEDIWIAESARVHDSAVLQGPVVVGPDCEIGPTAVVGPDTALGRNVTIGAGAVVRRSVIDVDTRIDPDVTFIDCVTGQGVRVGAGTVAPGGPGDVRVGDRIFENANLGAVLADRVEAAGNVNLSPGTLIGPSARLGAGVTASGTVPADAEVVR